MSGCLNRGAVLAIADSLTGLAENAGIGAGEVERLIGIRCGVWPMTDATRALWWPTVEQADRLDALHGLLVGLVATMGGRESKRWLRSRNVGLGMTPMRFMLSRLDGPAVLGKLILAEQGAC